MSENMRGTLVTRNRYVALGALAVVAAAPAVSGNAMAATGLVAAPQAPAVLASQSLGVNLTTHDTVPRGQTASIQSLSTSSAHGKVTKQNSTTVIYTPGSYYASLAKGSNATDKFSYCLTDNAGASSCNTVTVTIFGTATGTTTPPPATPPTPPTNASYTCVRNWYVAPNGSDNAAGTTTSTPWATIQHADSSGQLRAGDCVNVAPGTYNTGGIWLSNGGNANSPTGYVVYRSTTPKGAKIKAASQGMYDIVTLQGNYLIMDGFEVDGSNEGLSSNPVSGGSGFAMTGHHLQVLNNLIHDAGGEGIGAEHTDWLWIIGNTAYNNAKFNGYQMSGISIWEPNPVAYTATSADTNATYHIIVQNNITHDNAETYVSGAHTDGNGIIMDSFTNPDNGNGAYPYKTLVQGNTAYNNGARGIHSYLSEGITFDSNIAYNNNLDTGIQGTWRGELSNAQSYNNTWTNNQAAASSVAGSQWLQYNTAVLDGGNNSGVTWKNNANFDTRTGGKSYQIDNSATAASFPANNPLGKAL
jgi:parallel beta-helix repeat protein